MELDIDQLFHKYTDDQQVREATQAPTLRTGTYRLQVTSVEPRKDDRDDSLTPGRQYARLGATALDRGTGEKKGRIFFNVSWEPHYREAADGTRRLDLPSRLWGQLIKALDAHGNSVGIVLRDMVPNLPFDAYVREAFRMPDGTFRDYDPEDDKARRALLDEGGEPLNMVYSISRAK